MLQTTIGKKTFEVTGVYRSNEILRGMQREVILLHIPVSAIGYDDLYALVKDTDKLATISTKNTESTTDSEAPVSTAQFDNYIVPGEPVISVSSEAGQDIFVLKLGKLTYIEEQLQRLGIDPLG